MIPERFCRRSEDRRSLMSAGIDSCCCCRCCRLSPPEQLDTVGDDDVEDDDVEDDDDVDGVGSCGGDWYPLPLDEDPDEMVDEVDDDDDAAAPLD